MSGRRRRPRVLIVVQNLSVPLDRRVWQESRALVAEGIAVSVICPSGPGEARFEQLEGVDIHRYRPPRPRPGVAGFVIEFAYCWLATALLAVRIGIRRGYDVVQACNPPDTYWALALLLRPFGVRFVYDQHDLCPEIFAARFPDRLPVVARAVGALERATYRTADHVVVPNESYRSVAIRRGHLRPGEVTVVRSGPHPDEMRRGTPIPELREGAKHLCCYVGIMGPQDGVDLLLDAVADLVFVRGRTDVHVALLGFGDCYDELRKQSADLGIVPWVTFTGRADREVLGAYLSTADVGLSPDPKSAFNDVSTMNKVLEYMAHELPVVSFDLTESRVSAGDAAVYVPDGDIAGFAEAVDRLLDDPERRSSMGRVGRIRIETAHGWHRQAPSYVAVHRRLLGRDRAVLPLADVEHVTSPMEVSA